MPERPLIIMPEPRPSSRPRGYGGGSLPPAPLMNDARKKTFDEKFDAVRKHIQSVSAGIAPETALVIEVSGSIQNLQNAVRRVDGLEWLAEVGLDEVDISENEYESDEDREKAKKAGGRLYLMLSSETGLQKILSLWRKHKTSEPLSHGDGRWDEVFKHLSDVRVWNEIDRMQDTGILSHLQSEIDIKRDTNSLIFFEIELHCYPTDDKADNAVNGVKVSLKQIDGEMISKTRIPEIGFHAVKVACSPRGADKIIQYWKNKEANEQPEILAYGAVKYLRPTAQQLADSPEPVILPHDSTVPATDDRPIVIALLDGHPMVGHRLLKERLEIDDPENFADAYEAGQMKHGTTMASLICHGDLSNSNRETLARKIYVRPIMKPKENFSNGLEEIPADKFPEDLINRSIRHMLNKADGVVRSVRVINLSLGNIDQPFLREMSSWARLLDWLSWKYQVLFIVSAGNYSKEFKIPVNDDSLHQRTILEMDKSIRNRKILSPAESMNAITVGALSADHSTVADDDPRIDAMDGEKITAEYSRLGGGYRRSIKPEILVAGGRQMYTVENGDGGVLYLTNDCRPIEPGQQGAYVGRIPEDIVNTAHSRGTSNAAALTTHAAGLIYEVIDELRSNDSELIPENYDALLIKALLVHGAGWRGMDDYLQVLKSDVNRHKFRRYVAQYLGYGEPDFSRVMECTNSRVTTLGFGSITVQNNHRFVLPIPSVCRGIRYTLSVTLAYFTPINPFHFNYRGAKLFFECPLSGGNRQDTDFQQVRGGTVQHEIFGPVTINSNTIEVTVQCNADAINPLDESIPYALALTLEAEQKTNIDIYNEIKAETEQRIST